MRNNSDTIWTECADLQVPNSTIKLKKVTKREPIVPEQLFYNRKYN